MHSTKNWPEVLRTGLGRFSAPPTPLLEAGLSQGNGAEGAGTRESARLQMPRPLRDRLLLRKAELLGGAQSLRSAIEPRPPHAQLRSGGGPWRGWAGPGRGGARGPGPAHRAVSGLVPEWAHRSSASGAPWPGCWRCLARREEWVPNCGPPPLGSWELLPPVLHRSGPWPCPAPVRTHGCCARPAGTVSAAR